MASDHRLFVNRRAGPANETAQHITTRAGRVGDVVFVVLCCGVLYAHIIIDIIVGE